MRRIDKALSANGSTGPLPLDARRNPFNVALSVVASGTPTLVSDVTYTYDDVQAPGYTEGSGNWFVITAMAAQAGNADALLQKPCTAVRMVVSGYSAGKAVLTVIQAGDGP